MEHIQDLLDELTKKLAGHNALVQLQIGDRHYIRKIGDMNKLGESAKTIELQEANRRFLPWLKEEIEHANVCESTRKNHYTMWRNLKEYAPKVGFHELDSEYVIGYDRFLRSKGNSVNTIAKHMTLLRRYLHIALELELITKSPFTNYAIKMQHTHRFSLTERQRMKIERQLEEVALTAQEREVLDAFRFSCVTGLRFSDLKQLNARHIITINRAKWLVMNMQKTKHEIRLPLELLFGGLALEILETRKKTPTFDLPDNKQTNLLLRQALQKFGINEHVTFHCARHTMATLLLDRGIPITTIQSLLGHTSLRTTQIYSAVTDHTIANDLMKGFVIKPSLKGGYKNRK